MLRTLWQKGIPLLGLFFVAGLMATPAFAQTIPANGSLGAGGNCEPNANACSSGYVCQMNNNGNDTCVAASAATGQIACDVGSVAAGIVCVSCADGSTADKAADCPGGAVSNSNGNSSGSGSSPNDVPALTNPLNATSLTDLLNEVLSYVVEIGLIFLTLMLIYVGYLFVAAQGSDEKLKGARSALLWTVVGGLLLLGAKAIAVAIAATASAL